MEFTPTDEKKILIFNEESADTATLRMVATEDPRNPEMVAFCEALQRVAPRIRWIREEGDDSKPPAIEIGKTIIYHAVPGGAELDPFLEAVRGMHRSKPRLPEDLKALIDTLKIPVELTIFISTHCPFCPQTVRKLIPLAIYSDNVHLRIIDGSLFPEKARKEDIRSVPTILIGKNIRLSGTPDPLEVMKIASNQDIDNLDIDFLERMITDGNAFNISQAILDAGAVFSAFIELITHDHFTIRLGAMAAMEHIIEEDIDVARTALDDLQDRFDDFSDTVKGDILYIVGEIGRNRHLPFIRNVLNDSPAPELKEAALEAMEKIERNAVTTS